VTNDINATMLSGTMEEVPDAYRDASPLFQVDTESTPILVIHGARDDSEHSRRLVAVLQAAGLEVIYGQFPRGGHFDTESRAFSGS
jgi:dipeptidyl aminopeptidase/acylaminoacyl peptidase